MKKFILFGCLLATAGSCYARETELLELAGPYLGQKPPGQTAEVFAPGIVSTQANEVLYGFFHAGATCLFERSAPGFNRDWISIPISMTRQEPEGGLWKKPVEAGVRGKPWYYAYPDAPLGIVVFFAWRKNLDGSGPIGDIDIWKTARGKAGWAEPQNLGSPVNMDGVDSWPSWTSGQTLYFFSTRAGGRGRADLYRSPPIQGRYSQVENLGPAVNSEYADHDPFIAPDESCLIWCSDRPGGGGANDLYISFKQADGEWSEAANMGKRVNSPFDETRPSVTTEGKYLFFNRMQSGNRDIYWVDARIIEDLRPRHAAVGK